VSVAEWVLAVERAYVAATRTGVPAPRENRYAHALEMARGAAAALASHHLAVASPRSFGLVIDDLVAASVVTEAHLVWFTPRDIRCTDAAVAAACGGRVVSIAEALACDIVCVQAGTRIAAGQLRRGTHVNVLGTGVIDPEIVATITDEPNGLPALAAGLVDGRHLDEITIFIAGDAAIALAAL
jgi:hypothetical protein